MSEHEIEFSAEDDGDTWWRCRTCGEDATGYGLGGPDVDQAALAAGEHQLPAEVQDELAEAGDESIEAWRDAARAAITAAAQQAPDAWAWLPEAFHRA